ncbi:MAG TPA: DUF2892 domain-containing protein [Azonexus sp.]|nr:DUF2892 domain-containing protein [Azonexus sp.]
MTIERIIRIMAGFFVLLSLALGWHGSPLFVSEWFLAFTAFVGFNLLQSGFTGFCPPEKLLAKMGVKRGGDGPCCG